MVPFWVAPYYIRDPRRDHNFANHPYELSDQDAHYSCMGRFPPLELHMEARQLLGLSTNPMTERPATSSWQRLS